MYDSYLGVYLFLTFTAISSTCAAFLVSCLVARTPDAVITSWTLCVRWTHFTLKFSVVPVIARVTFYNTNEIYEIIYDIGPVQVLQVTVSLLFLMNMKEIK